MTRSPLPGWQDSASDASFSDPATFARRVNSFERQIRIRNWIEYAAGALVTVLFGGLTLGSFWKGEILIGLASLMIVIGTWVVMWSLRRRAGNLDRRPEDTCLDHLRRQYGHQLRALLAVPVWYIGPLVPGTALFYFAVTKRVADAAGWSVAIEGMWAPLAVSFGIFALIALANWIAARGLLRKIDELDALG